MVTGRGDEAVAGADWVAAGAAAALGAAPDSVARTSPCEARVKVSLDPRVRAAAALAPSAIEGKISYSKQEL